VMNGSGKGVMKEAPQMFAQELNESELSEEVSKFTQAVSETGIT